MLYYPLKHDYTNLSYKLCAPIYVPIFIHISQRQFQWIIHTFALQLTENNNKGKKNRRGNINFFPQSLEGRKRRRLMQKKVYACWYESKQLPLFCGFHVLWEEALVSYRTRELSASTLLNSHSIRSLCKRQAECRGKQHKN